MPKNMVMDRAGVDGLAETLTQAEAAAAAAAELELRAAAARAAADQARAAAEAERSAAMRSWAADVTATGEGDRDRAMQAVDAAQAAFRTAAAERPETLFAAWLAVADARTAQWAVEKRLERAREIRGEHVQRVTKDLVFSPSDDIAAVLREVAMQRWGDRDGALRAELEGVREGRADG